MFKCENNENVDNEIKDYLAKDRDSLTDEDFVSKPKRGRKKILLLGLALLLLFAVGLYSLRLGHSTFAEEKVRIDIETPDRVGGGAEDSLVISCVNDNKVALTEARLEIIFPEDFVLKSSDKEIERSGNAYYWNAGTIPAQGASQIRIFGRVVGKLGEEKTFRTLLRYKPANFNSQFEAEKSQSIKVTSVPVELSLDVPENMKDSSEGEFSFTFKNKDKRAFAKSRLEAEFPKDFVFASSDPAFAKKEGSENTYFLETADLGSGNSRSAKIRGAFQSQNDKEIVKARVYLEEENGRMIEYVSEEKEVALEKTELLIKQTVNGQEDYAPSSKEELTYRIVFKNQSSKELKQLALSCALEGAFDLGSLQAGKASVRGNQVTWRASEIPALALLPAGSEGSVEFKVKVADLGAQVRKESDRNYALKSNVTVSPAADAEKLLVKNELDSRIKAELALDVTGYFNDDGRIPNGGELPPRVGEQTYYTIHWSLRNSFNDVENIRIVSVLPHGVGWTGKYVDSQGKTKTDGGSGTVSPAAEGEEAGKITEEKFFFDSNANALVWELPKLKANAGVLTAAKEIIFQIEATPDAADAGRAMTLSDNITASGYDNFILKGISSSAGKQITTQLTDDFSIGAEEAIVKN